MTAENMRGRRYHDAGPTTTAPGTIPRRTLFECPLCGSPKADITARPDGGYWTGCWRCQSSMGMGEYARALADALDLPSAGNLIADPHRFLAAYLGPQPSIPPAAELPTEAMLAEWRSRLQADPNALKVLHRRGLSDRTIAHIEAGRNDGGIVFPVRDRRGALRNVVIYTPNGQPKYKGTAGQGSQLYPHPPKRETAVILGAGFLDPPRGRQEGLPVTTTTCGATLPIHLVRPLALRRRRVAVVFDVGEEAAAARAATLLNAAGARAWPVTLPMPEKGDDLTDWFQAGRSARELYRVIRRCSS